MAAIGYLFAGAPDGRVLHEASARALLSVPYTYVLHGDGLAVRVALPGLTTLLPLHSWQPGLVRDLEPAAPDVAGAVARAIAASTAGVGGTMGLGCSPLSVTSPSATHCYAVARRPDHPLKAAVGPYHTGMEPPARYSYIVAANGVFVWTRSEALEAFVPVTSYPEETIWGLHALTPGARLLVPRVPAETLAYLIDEARREAGATGHELLWQLCWREGAWAIVKPEQTNRRGSVSYDPSVADGVIKVHTHGRYGTFWSATDDRDERHAEYNIIVGDLRARQGPSLLCRVGVYGRTLDVPAATVIEGDLPARDRYGEAGSPRDADGPASPVAVEWALPGAATAAATGDLSPVVANVLARVLHLVGDQCAQLAGELVVPEGD